MTEFLDVEGGRIAYDVVGEGPLVVLSHGMGDRRSAFRFLVPMLAEAGYRVVNADMRGHGESSTGWASISRTDVAGDLLALVERLGAGPAVIVGHSHSGGAATIAAAERPDLVAGIVEVDPFTRGVTLDVRGFFGTRRYRNGITLLLLASMLGRRSLWMRYLNGVAFPGTHVPVDHAEQLAALDVMLADPARMDALKKAASSKPVDAGAQLGNVRCPALLIFGTQDPDFARPEAEAAAITALMPQGLASTAFVEGAGHYPHTQYPVETGTLVLGFLKEHHNA